MTNITMQQETNQQLPPAAIAFDPIGNLSGALYSPQVFRAYLQLYICLTIIANLLFLFWDGNGGDIGFWEDWVRQLVTRGYADFNGNYPPMYIHWLYLVAQFYDYLQIPVENNLFIKHLSQLPVLVCHIILVTIVFGLVKRYSTQTSHFHLALLLTALNPAILFDGPIWGQIDVIPLIPVLLALLASQHHKYRLATMPLYALGLLTKFQMIAFAPVIGIIFFRHIKIHLAGGLISLLVIALAFTPAAISGNATQAFKLAYLDVFHQYSATTMGASNIWILLTGNAAPDHIILFGVEPDSLLAPILKAKNLGILAFFLVCLAVFLQGMNKLIHGRFALTQQGNTSEMVFYAMVCAIAFYTFLPAMHERYLIPAVVISLVYYALDPQKIIYPLALTFISAFNLTMTMGIKTNHVWPVISWVMLAACVYSLLELALNDRWRELIRRFTWFILRIRYLSLIFFIIAVPCITFRLYHETKVIEVTLAKDQRWLSELPIAYSRQDYGSLKIDKNIHDKTLSAGDRRYAKGMGTHANSTVEFSLAGQAKSLIGAVGLDDSVESGGVQFSIWGDGKLLWESAKHYGAEKPETFEVDLSGVQHLRLHVDGLKDISSDHANWLNPVITLAAETPR